MQNLFFFEGNKPHLVREMNFDKVAIVGGSNNAGVWGRSPQPPEANRGSGTEPLTLKRFFTSFSKKKIRILSILWSKFLLKMRIKNDCKKCAGARLRARATTCPPPLATPL